ncbi:unnamed protein product [Linum tenue]|uniref:Acetyl-coenzyme A synthetase N-terminal domain-containing protein n=1 Tax=Linum tenue TaxID=586396 RepID=A0AAV0RES8_9ROSI|nr:unnamed protein product [Linum tenue]
MISSSFTAGGVGVGLRTHDSPPVTYIKPLLTPPILDHRCNNNKKSKFRSTRRAVKAPQTQAFLLFPHPFSQSEHTAAASSSSVLPMANCSLNTTTNHLRHVESMAVLPSGAGKIPRLNAVILGEALASEEDDLVFPSDDFARQALLPSAQKYLEMYKRSVEDPAGFWSDIASQFLWKSKWGDTVCSENFDIRNGNVYVQWFKGGITNICYNCLDRNVDSGNGDKIAFHWEGNERGFHDSLTYTQLLSQVCQVFLTFSFL